MISKYLAIGAAVLALLLVGSGYLLKNALKEIGAVREALEAARADNEEWTKSEKRHERYVEEVQSGFKAMQQKLDDARKTNQTFQQQVRSNARSNDALDPNELGALRLWGQAGPANEAGPGKGGTPAKPPGVR